MFISHFWLFLFSELANHRSLISYMISYPSCCQFWLPAIISNLVTKRFILQTRCLSWRNVCHGLQHRTDVHIRCFSALFLTKFIQKIPNKQTKPNNRWSITFFQFVFLFTNTNTPVVEFFNTSITDKLSQLKGDNCTLHPRTRWHHFQ